MAAIKPTETTEAEEKTEKFLFPKSGIVVEAKNLQEAQEKEKDLLKTLLSAKK